MSCFKLFLKTENLCYFLSTKKITLSLELLKKIMLSLELSKFVECWKTKHVILFGVLNFLCLLVFESMKTPLRLVSHPNFVDLFPILAQNLAQHSYFGKVLLYLWCLIIVEDCWTKLFKHAAFCSARQPAEVDIHSDKDQMKCSWLRLCWLGLGLFC